MADFASKKVNYIFRSEFKFCALMEYKRFVDDDSKLVCFGNMFANFSLWFIARTTATLLNFKWRYVGSHQDVLETLSFFKTYYCNILKKFTVFSIRCKKKMNLIKYS